MYGIFWFVFSIENAFEKWHGIRFGCEYDYCAPADEEWRRVAAAAADAQRLLAPGGGVTSVGGVALRTQAPLGAPLILSPRMSAPGGQAGLLNGSGAGAAAGLLSPGEPAHQLIYASPYADYANYAALTAAANPLLTADYATADHTGGLFTRW